MQASTPAQAQWLRQIVTVRPRGSDTFVVTHWPNISAAFPQLASGLADGEALIFAPDGKGGVVLRARLKIDEWPGLAR